MKRKTIIIYMAVLLAVLLILVIDAAMIPTGIRTQGCMVMLKQQLEHYKKQHRRLPDSLQSFRGFNKNHDITKDEWGNQIQYSVDSEEYISLKSVGRDNKQGGKGRNSDITLRFKLGDSIVMPFNSEHIN